MNKISSLRWPILLGYLGVLSLLLACAAIGLGPSAAQQGMLQLDQGTVKVQNSSGSWEPLAGTSTFEMVGKLENTNPWTVAGKALATNASTQIAQGLKTGDLVRVRGAALDNGTWLAYSIEPAGSQQPGQTIILIGKVTSVNPWVVNGTTFQVTNDTVINGDIQPGMLVRVEILLQDDGTWEVISISPLSEIPSSSGCATVVATVESINGSQIKFLGWPEQVAVNAPASYGTDGNDAGVDISTLKPGQQVLVVVCVSGNNQLVITKIVVVNNEDDNNNNETGGEQKVLICHKPAKKGGHTISVASSAVPAHLGHGDKLGACR
jgi:hypothetical protein